MSRTRKTIPVDQVLFRLNQAIRHAPERAQREALNNVATALLMDVGAYQGFSYVHRDATTCLPSCVGSYNAGNGSWSEPEYTQWREAHLDDSMRRYN